MKVDSLMVYGGLAVAGLIAVAYLTKKAGDAASAIGGGITIAADKVGTAINPINPDNLIYSGTSAVVGVFADYPGATVGSMFADTFKPSSEKDVDAMLSGKPVTAPAKSAPGLNWFRSDKEKEVDALYGR